MHSTTRAMCAVAFLVLAALAAHAAIVQWEFDGTLDATPTGNALVPAYAPPAAAADVSFAVATIDGTEASVARFSRGTTFALTHGLAPNGGGTYLNQYTLIMDVMFPDRAPSGGWAALVQTDVHNISDGEWFVNPQNGIGISGNYGGTVEAGQWRRLALVVDLVAGTFTSYIDGLRVQQNTGEAFDGRFSAGPVLLLFADEDAENAEGFVNSVQLQDVALGDAEIAALGAASAAGIPSGLVPLPAPVGLWEFENGADLTAATMGQDFVLVGTHQAIEGVTPGDGAVRIGPGSHYRCAHGLAPSGGEFVNAYSFLFDFRIPAIGPWYCFFQTNVGNANDGDCFVRTDGAVGVAATGYSTAKLAAGTWYRLLVAVDNTQGVYDIYLDGERILDGTAQALDDRFALDPTVLFFADENGEDGLIDVSLTAVYDHALAATDVLRLGGPGLFDPDNRAPAVVVAPAGPDRTATQEQCEFAFRATDGDGDRVQLRIDWGDGIVSSWTALQDAALPIAALHTYNRTGVLAIRAQARDEHGATSSWTQVQSIRVSGDVRLVFLTAPYLQNVKPDGITIMWELDGFAECSAQYGLDASYGATAAASAQPTNTLSYVYRAVLTGLAPATTYCYRVTGENVAGPDRTFTTAPAGPVAFSFAVSGDTQGTNHGTHTADPYEPTKAMFAHMAEADVDFMVSVGDIAESGADYTGAHAYYLDRIVPALGPVAPWFVAWGNHDAGRTAVIRKFADHPSTARAGFDAGWGSYSFDYANCHFVCIDYDTAANDIVLWLESDLAAAAQRGVRFTFLFVHVPPYCEIWIDGDAWLRQRLVPLLVKYGVDVCFSGHTHEYERGRLDDTYYCVTGGGSWLDFPEPYTVNWPHITVGGFQSLGGGIDKGLVNEYVEVVVDGDTAECRMQAFYPDGTWRGTLDTFTIDRCDNGNGIVDDLDGNGVPDSCEGALQLPGDCNQDAHLDIADVVCLLGFLFAQRPAALPCGDGTAADTSNIALESANGDARIDIADAIYLLGHLFASGPAHALGTACTPIGGCPAVCRP